jgi:hypothetical protein
MQMRELNPASIEATNNKYKKAENSLSQAGSNWKLWHITSLSLVKSLMVAGFFISLAPLRASGDQDTNTRFEHADGHDRGVRQGIRDLEAKVASLEAIVSALQDKVTSLQTQLTAVRSNPALGLVLLC